MDENTKQKLEKRLGKTAFLKRLHVHSKLDKISRHSSLCYRLFRHTLLLILRITGLYQHGYEEFKNIRVVHKKWSLPKLPAEFNGYKLLQLTDLHLCLDQGRIAKSLSKILPHVHADTCVFTGDFSNGAISKDNECNNRISLATQKELEKITDMVECEKYGVLGNHDHIDLVDTIEATGIQLLLNETIILKKGGDQIFLSGVDDASFFKSHDLDKASEGVPKDAFSILLSHTPEIYKIAQEKNYDIMLSGHTHGGQICLPGGRHIKASNCHSGAVSRSWFYKSLQGYTSPGTGACKLPIRICCPPEITIHEFIKTSIAKA